MSANEIAERFAAACWVRFGSLGGEAVNELAPAQVGYRSRVGFQDRILTTVDATTIPLYILPLDRVFSRRETSVFAGRLGTVGPLAGSRDAYPQLFTPPDDVANVFMQPMLLAWMGPDLTNPTYLPFGLPPPGGVVPGDVDLDLYDAIAILLPVGDFGPLSGDVCVAVYKHPQPDTNDAPLEEVLPAEAPPLDPILELDPVAWWRMDDYTTETDESGTVVVSFDARSQSGSEGALELGTPVTAPLAPDVIGNNQASFKDRGNALTPQGPLDWNFLGSSAYTAFFIFYPSSGNTGAQSLWISATLPPTPQYECISDLANDQVTWSFGVYGIDGGAEYVLPWAAAADVLQNMRIVVDSAGGQEVTVESTSSGSNGGPFITPPPDAAEHPIFNSTVDGGELGIFEILIFDRALDGTEDGVVQAYFNTRYGV